MAEETNEEKIDTEEMEKSLEEGAEAAAEGSSDAEEKEDEKKEGFELTEDQKSNLSMILDLPLRVTVELGRSRVLIQDILQYGQGSVVELNKKAGDPLEITVANQLIAKGEVVVVNEKFAVRILEIVDAETRIKKMGAAGRDSTHVLNTEETQVDTPEEQPVENAG